MLSTISVLLWIFLSYNNVALVECIWPIPRSVLRNENVYQVRDRNPDIIPTGHKCALLTRVINRISQEMNMLNVEIRRSRNEEAIKKIVQLKVHLTEPCEDYPYLGMNETYELTIAPTSKLEATSIWGIIRGLETFVQLFYEYNKNIYIRGMTILDYPNYEHRGLMLDTGKLYVPVHVMTKILDGMAMNKLNVFHWRLCDDRLCPIKSEIFSNMSNTAKNVYTKNDVKLIVEFARERGIRVVPDFNMPGPLGALKETFPGLFLQCKRKQAVEVLNPIIPETYRFLKRLLGELNNWFPDEFIHLGGDRVYPECWEHHRETLKHMTDHNLSLADLLTEFYKDTLKQIKPEMNQIMWQDVFDLGVRMPVDNHIIQVWKNKPKQEMEKLLNSGYQIIYSSTWSLKHKSKEHNFEKFYLQDPRSLLRESVNRDLLQNIVGGEACMWTERVQHYNLLLYRIFPRTNAVAEVLWSLTDGSQITKHGITRMLQHAASMTKRGVPTKTPD